MITVDAMGDVCPVPIVKTKNAIRQLGGAGEVEVFVDNNISVQNLKKMAQQKEPTEPVPVFEGEDMAQVKSQLVKLIICDGMTIGSVILISGDRPTSESDEKCSRIAAGFISAQIGESI